jgi:ligand-binding sensor domain-containing protein
VTRKGLLWVGSDQGAGIFNYRKGIYQTLGSEKGLPGPNVRRIFEDPDGTLWFCCDRWPNPTHVGGLASLKDGSWKVYDVVIENVSLVLNYRTQFNDILAKNTPEQLLEILRKKVKGQ